MLCFACLRDTRATPKLVSVCPHRAILETDAFFVWYQHLRSKLCDLYESDLIFDKFQCAPNGGGSNVATGSYGNQFRCFDAATGVSDTFEVTKDPQRLRRAAKGVTSGGVSSGKSISGGGGGRGRSRPARERGEGGFCRRRPEAKVLPPRLRCWAPQPRPRNPTSTQRCVLYFLVFPKSLRLLDALYAVHSRKSHHYNKCTPESADCLLAVFKSPSARLRRD